MLHHHINNWHEIQSIYMLGAMQLMETEVASELQSTPTHQNLYLPFSISPDIGDLCCIHGLASVECHIQLGQADDALNKVHQQLWITSSIIQFKRGQHQASQRLSHKSQALIQNLPKKLTVLLNSTMLHIQCSLCWIPMVTGLYIYSHPTSQKISTYQDEWKTTG